MPDSMTSTRLVSIVAAILLSLHCESAFAQRQQTRGQVSFRNPPRSYESVSIDGRTFRVEQQLAKENPALMIRALKRLSANIDQALSLFPEEHQRFLRPIPFSLMYGSDADGGGHDNGLAYFQKDAPKHRDWLDPQWGSSIVVYSAANYVGISEFWGLKSVLHELAHAYQLEQWPEKQPEIMRAYEDAMSRGLYHGVMDDKGKTLAKAYAATNQLEYFAEATCMYYIGCNYAPRNRRAFRAYDPAGFRMIEQMWSVDRATKPEKFPRRLWQDPSGKFEIVARFVRHDSAAVTLSKDEGAELEVAIERLSEIDQDYLDRVPTNR